MTRQEDASESTKPPSRESGFRIAGARFVSRYHPRIREWVATKSAA